MRLLTNIIKLIHSFGTYISIIWSDFFLFANLFYLLIRWYFNLIVENIISNFEQKIYSSNYKTKHFSRNHNKRKYLMHMEFKSGTRYIYT